MRKAASVSLSQFYRFGFILLTIALLLPRFATAAALNVSTPRVVGNNPNVPHYTYGGALTVLKAIVTGGTAPYTVEWDYTGTGTFVSPVSIITNQNGSVYDVTVFYAYPDPANIVTYSSIVRITDSASNVMTATYKVEVVPSALAGDAVKADKAVDDGLWYLHRNLVRSSYNGAPTARTNDSAGGGIDIAATSVAIQAYQNKTHWLGGDPSDPYTADVQAMHNYVLSNLQVYTVLDSTIEAGDPDATNINNQGLYPSVGNDDIYVTGMLLAALGTADVPDNVADSRLPAAVAGKTYRWVCQEIIDYFSDMQSPVNGGWRYNVRRNSSPDGSQHTWVASAMYFTELKMPGIYIRPQLKTLFNQAINSLLFNGGTDYSGDGSWVNLAKSAGNMGSMTFVAGDKAGAIVSEARGPEQGGTGETARITAARLYVGNNWNTGGSNGGNIISGSGDFYAMYSLMKGCRSFFPPIQYFKSTGGTEYFWYDLYRTHLLGKRDATAAATNGRMLSDVGYISSGYTSLCTGVGVEILEQAFMIAPPVAVATANSLSAPPNSTIFLHHNQSYHLDPTLSIVKYEWDFGTDQGGGVYNGIPDGVYDYSTTDRNVAVSFAVGGVGTYNPVLRVTDNKTPTPQTATDSSLKITVSTGNHAPVPLVVPPGSGYDIADYIFDINDVTVNAHPLSLDGSASYDPDAGDTLQAYKWTLPSGTVATATTTLAAKPALWSSGNTYTITLEVQDNNSAWGLATGQVYVVADSTPVPTTTSATIDQDSPGTYITLDGTYLRAPKALSATVTALPGAGEGTLYQVDGTTPINIGDAVTDSARRVLYVPPAGQSGLAFTTLAYTLNDTVMTSAAQTVTVNILGPGSIAATQGTPQSAGAGAPFTWQLKAKVLHSDSTPAAGVVVTFAAPGSGASGTFAGGASTAVSDASGIATASVFTANGVLGSYTVSASAPGIVTPATFSLTNTVGAPATVTATAGTPQSGAPSTAFATALQATVTDAFGNLVPGATVTFTAPSSGASGTFAGGANTAVSDASGIATAAVFTANATPGTYSVTAACGLATSASFSLSNGSLLAISADNKTKLYGAPLPALTATFTGLVGGDTAAVFTTQPAITTTATTNSYVGTYPISISGAVGPAKYIVSYAAGTLTVLPSVTIGGAPTMSAEGSSISLTSAVGDPGASSLTYVWHVAASNGQSIADGSAASFDFTPNATGSYAVTLSVTDGSGYTGTDSKAIIVINVPPTGLIALPGGPYLEGSAITVTGSATDPGAADTFSYSWRITKNGLDYASATHGPGLPSSDTFAFTPNSSGDYVVALTLIDKDGGAGVASSQAFTVANVTFTAQITGAPNNSAEGTPITLGVSVTDPGVHTFTYLWTATADNGQTLADGTGSTFTFTPRDQGNYTVSVTVTDDDGSSGVAPAVRINASNVAPAAEMALSSAPYPEGSAITATGKATDPGLVDTFSYAWLVTKDGLNYTSAANGPGLGASNTFSFTPGIAGRYTIALSITDKDGDVGVTPAQTITVASVPPAVAINGAPGGSPEGTRIGLTSTVTSAGSMNTFSYAWSVAKNGALFAHGNAASFEFTPDHSGDYVVTLAVTASGGGATTVSVAIPVTSAAPVFSSNLMADANPAMALQTVHFICAATDADPLVWNWDFGDGVVEIGGASAAHAFSPAGEYTVTVTATNTSGQMTSQTLAMHIDAVGAALADPSVEIDSDGDGVSDAMEAALGTNPLDPASTPLSATAAPVQDLPVKKMGAKLNFAKPGSDSVIITGMLPVPAGFNPAGQKLLVDVGGIIQVFPLDKHGFARVGNNQFRMTLKRSRGAVPAQMSPFSLRLPRGTFVSVLANDGLVATPTSNSQRDVTVTVILNQTMFQKAVSLVYNNRFGTNGSAKGVINVYTR